MIECTDETIYYTTFRGKNRKPIKRKVKRFFVLCVIFTIIGATIFQVNNGVFDLVADTCEDQFNSIALSSVNSAIITSFNDKINYTDIIHIEKNKNGDISLMSSDALKINSISRIIAENTEILLKTKLNEGVKIPLFAFFGLKFLSGFGPKINYHAIVVAGVNCKFDGTFTSVGINQTLHSLYITVECKIDVEFLYKKKTVVCSSDVLVSEAVLVGNVPEVYLNGGLFR